MRKIFTLAAAVLASLSMWATDYVLLDSIDFTNTTNFPAVTYTGQKVTVNGVYFNAKSSKNIKVNNTTPGVDFDGQNGDATNHNIGIPVTGVLNSLKVIVYHDYNNTSANFKVGISHADNNDPSKSQTWDLSVTNSGTKNKNDFVITKTGLEGTNYIVWAMESSSSYKVIKRIAIYTEVPDCTDPAEALSLSSNAAGAVYEGDEITFSTTGGNGALISIEGTNSETITANKWTAVAGTHTFTASQAKNGDYCAQESQLVITVAATTPVTAANVEGPTAGYVGDELTYTVTAANATDYEWYVDGVAANTNAATFKYTAVLGSHTIYATATNSFTATPVQSNSIALTVAAAPLNDTYIWKKGSGYTGCVTNPNVDANANQQSTVLTYSTATFDGMSAMGRASTEGTTVTLTIAAKAGYYLNSICVYGKLEESAGAQISWDGENWENIAAYSDSKKEYNAPDATTPVQFIIKFVSASTSSGGLWWRNAFVTLSTLPDATITYNSNGGSGTMEPTINTVAACTFTAPEGKEFDVWNTAADATGQDYNAGDRVYANTTLYAIWRTVGVQSDDATLKALAVEGYTLTPAFAADVYSYSITKAFSTPNPAKSAVSAMPNSPKAKGYVVDSTANALTVTVTAEDNSTQVYTINILSEDAKKDLLKAIFANGANGYIANGNINVPYLAGETVPALDSVAFWNADGEPTYAVVEGNLVVTGADSKTVEYTITYVPVTPLATLPEDTVTFDSTEVVLPTGYIYTVYGWDASKGVKFAKDVEEASNHRISEGKDRIYLALPAAKDVVLVGGSAGARSIQVTVNGVVDTTVTKTPKDGEEIKISLAGDHANFVGIESNGNNGDAGFIKMFLTAPDPSAIINTADEVKAVKVLRNGQLFIEKNGVLYNAQGVKVIGEK